MKPCISLLCSGIRINNWLKIYDTLKHNKTNFEIVFVGSNKPNFQLNKNIKYIFSTVKPTQCWEIALRNCSGEFVMYIADDIFFEDNYLLDKLYNKFDKEKNNQILSPALLINGNKHNINFNRYLFKNIYSPLLPFLIFTKKKFIIDVGGIDSRFIAVRWDIDLALRLYKYGCVLEYCPDLEINENLSLSGRSTLNLDYLKKDSKTLVKKWIFLEENNYIKSLNDHKFNDVNITTISQGPSGRWASHNKLYIKLITSETFFFINSVFRILIKALKYLIPKFIKKFIKKKYVR